MNSQTKRSVMELPEQLKTFIANEDWIFAKTYAATWPHEYIVQERVDNDLFLELANYTYSGDMHPVIPVICTQFGG